MYSFSVIRAARVEAVIWISRLWQEPRNIKARVSKQKSASYQVELSIFKTPHYYSTVYQI